MSKILKTLENRLTDEDKEFLQKIYEPTIITVPPGDACMNLCVTPDGEIRIYGRDVEFNQWGSSGGQTVYIASDTCGLSWKKHTVNEPLTIGSAGYSEKTGRYIAVYPNEYRSEWNTCFGKSGAWAILNDEGFDSSNNRYVKISDLNIHFLKLPMYLESVDRWIVAGQHRNEQHITHVVVAFSDDNGESWKTVYLDEYAPIFEINGHHKGVRWQEYSCEPTIVELSNGDLLMYIRTSQDYHYMHISKDHGETWSKPLPTDFHGTITMPVLHKLQDGRIVFFWCNNAPLPELDQTKVVPPLPEDQVKGIWEDVFTNRDVNHLAITEDDGNTWIGLRELYMNPHRADSSFRRLGGASNGDKSVHQAQIIELPFNKLLVHCGQHPACRRVIILDIDWLYETKRQEDFLLGTQNLTTHMFLKSVLGSKAGRRGHAAYNRTNGAVMLPSPDNDYEEVLSIGFIDDERLVYKKQGAVWNFPAANKGRVEIELQVLKSGVKLSLCDHWCNAFDETVETQAFVSFDVTKTDGWETVSIEFDTNTEKADIYINENKVKTVEISESAPFGLSYLHIQTLATEEDFEGTVIRKISKK